MTPTTQDQETQAASHSIELEQLQALPTSPFGMQFLAVPILKAPVPTNAKATTRSCDETSNDGTSKLDCVDDDDEDDGDGDDDEEENQKK